MRTVVRGVVGLGKILGKGVWLVPELLAVVLSFGVVAWVRHRQGINCGGARATGREG